MHIYLRELREADLTDYLLMNHPSRQHHRWNGPYFPKETEQELEERVEQYRRNIHEGNIPVQAQAKVIIDQETETLIGEVNWYWKSEETLWMEVGVVIFNEAYWGKGIGTEAVQLWITERFETCPQLVRLGLTTWSGNIPMMKVAEKLGMKQEAVYRKARIVDGEWYDSVSYGVLREEWSTQ